MSKLSGMMLNGSNVASLVRSGWFNVRTYSAFSVHYWFNGTFTAATVTGTGQNFAGITNGETAVLGDGTYDANITVTFATGDTTGAKVVARINAAFGYAFASLATGELKLTSRRTDGFSEVRVVSGSTGLLAKLGLTAATTAASSTVAGAISFEVSNEDHPSVMNHSGGAEIDKYIDHPVALTSVSPIAIVAGSPTTGMVNFVDQNYKWIRLVWTPSSAAGTIYAAFVAKGGIP